MRRKIFPGYVLIEMVLDDLPGTWSRTRPGSPDSSAPGSGNRPARLTEEEVNNILQTVEASVQKPKVRWNKGENVRVLTGPFADLTGKIEDVNLDKEKLRVMIELFGRDTPVSWISLRSKK